VSDPQSLAQLVLAAVTAELHGDRSSADAIYQELAGEDPEDVARTAVGMTTSLLAMTRPSPEALLQELASWVAETFPDN
jgi:hypothetical protein